MTPDKQIESKQIDKREMGCLRCAIPDEGIHKKMIQWLTIVKIQISIHMDNY